MIRNISRGYQSPANYLNYYTWQDADGHWHRSRAVTIAIYMRDQNQIAKFGESIDANLAQLHRILPPDLITVHTSDQPLQVKENNHLFLRALNEAIILVVIVSLIGFRKRRLALIMALAIPITQDPAHQQSRNLQSATISQNKNNLGELDVGGVRFKFGPLVCHSDSHCMQQRERLKYVSAKTNGSKGLTAMLVRPDGFVA